MNTFNMISPRLLAEGDTIAIVAPSGRLKSPEVLDGPIKILQSWGLKVRLGEHVFTQDHSYLAALDSKRLSDLQWAIDDPKIKAIICARGGYGCTRILDEVNFSRLKKNPKWIVGYSDITAIHLALSYHGILSIHGTMLTSFEKEHAEGSLNSLRESLFGAPSTIHATPNEYNRFESVQGKLVGGNLSLLADSLGTKYEINTQGCILVIEEINEYHYKVDRMFSQLKRAGKFEGLAGMVIGYMTTVYNPDVYTSPVESVIIDRVKEFSFPVGFGFPIGHEEPNNTFVCGGEYELRVGDNGGLLIPASR